MKEPEEEEGRQPSKESTKESLRVKKFSNFNK